MSGVAERVLGAPVPAGLRPLLTVTALSVAGQWMLTAYLPIYAVTQLPVTTGTAGALLAGAMATGLIVGPVGGRLADTVGRARVLVAGLVLQTAAAALLLVAPGRTTPAVLAATLLAIGFTLRTTGQNTLAADLSAIDDRDTVFALLRTAVNVAAAAGPALGAALLVFDWSLLWAGSLSVSLLALALVRRRPPQPSLPAREGPRCPRPDGETDARTDPASLSVPGEVPGDRRSALGPDNRRVAVALAASVLAWATYNAFEIVLPVATVDVYGLAPSTWGLLFLLNPIGVALLQVRLIAWTSWLTRAGRLLLATSLMGASFLLLVVTHRTIAIAAVVLAFTAGEILWGPASQALLVELAPPRRRGTVMGLLSSAATAGAVITSAGGLALLSRGGHVLTWCSVAGVAILSGLLFRLAARATTHPGATPQSSTCRN